MAGGHSQEACSFEGDEIDCSLMPSLRSVPCLAWLQGGTKASRLQRAPASAGLQRLPASDLEGRVLLLEAPIERTSTESCLNSVGRFQKLSSLIEVMF